MEATWQLPRRQLSLFLHLHHCSSSTYNCTIKCICFPKEITKRHQNESEQDFKRSWDLYRASKSEEKAEALEMAMEAFLRMSDCLNDSAQIANMFEVADSNRFVVDVARAFKNRVERSKNVMSNGLWVLKDLIDFFHEEPKGQSGAGKRMLQIFQILVTCPTCDIQAVLDAGLLSSLLSLIHQLFGSGISAISGSIVEDDESACDLEEHDAQFSNGSSTLQRSFTTLNDVDLKMEYRLQVAGDLMQVVEALARHRGAGKRSRDDDTLKLLFYMAVSPADDLSPPRQESVSKTTLQFTQYRLQVIQIIKLLLIYDSADVAEYIHAHQLVKVLLKAVKEYNFRTGDADYRVEVVALLRDCINLPSKPEAGATILREDLLNAHGYQLLVQFALNLSSSYSSKKTQQAYAGNSGQSDIVTASTKITTHSDQLGVNNGEIKLRTPLSCLLDIIIELAQGGSVQLDKAVDNATIINGKASIATKVMSNSSPQAQLDKKKHAHAEKKSAGADVIGYKIKDVFAVQVLQDVFLKAESLELQLEILDRLLKLLSSHPENYFVVEELRIMSLFLSNLSTFPRTLQERLLKLLEYVAIVLNIVPQQELLSLCYLLQQPLAEYLKAFILSFFLKLLSFDPHYKLLLREVGLLDVLIDYIKQCEISLEIDNSIFERDCHHLSKELLQSTAEWSSLAMSSLMVETTTLTWDCLVALVKRSDQNQAIFRKLGGIQAAIPLLASPSHRPGVLQLLSCVIYEDVNQSHPEEIKLLINILSSGSATGTLGANWKVDSEAVVEILWTLWSTLRGNAAAKDVFREAKGFMLLTKVLQNLQPDEGQLKILLSSAEAPLGAIFSTSPTLALHMEVFNALLHLMIVAASGVTQNRVRLHDSLMSQMFKQMISTLGLLCAEYERHIMELLFSVSIEWTRSPIQHFWSSNLSISLETMPHIERSSRPDEAIGNVFNNVNSEKSLVSKASDFPTDEILNIGAIKVLLSCFMQFTEMAQLEILTYVERLASWSSRNKDRLTSCGCVALLQRALLPENMPSSSLVSQGVQFLGLLGAYRISPSDLRILLGCLWKFKDSSLSKPGRAVFDIIDKMLQVEGISSENLSLSTFVEFSMIRVGHACIHVPLGSRNWPPAAGYSFVCWIRYEGGIKRSGCEELTLKKNSVSNKKATNHENLIRSPIIRIFGTEIKEEKGLKLMELFMDDTGMLTLSTGPTSTLVFKGVYLEDRVWYHLAIVHNKANTLGGFFQSSVANLYLNGSFQSTGKLGSSPFSIGRPLQAVIGTAASMAELCSLCWQLGSCYLFEEAISAPAIYLMYALGRAYHGLFQDSDLLRFVPHEACGGKNLAMLGALDLLPSSQHLVHSGLNLKNSSSQDGSEIIWEVEKLIRCHAQLSGRKLVFAFNGTSVNVSDSSGSFPVLNLVDPTSNAASPVGGLPHCGHLSGDAELLKPCSFGDAIRKIGGVHVVLALLEAAETRDMLRLALSLLVHVLHRNPQNSYDMLACRGYHLLALFLHHRIALLALQDLEHLFQIAACEASFPSSSGVSEPVQCDTVTREALAEDGVEAISPSDVPDDHNSSVESQSETLDGFDQEDVSNCLSDLGGNEVPEESSNCIVLANPDMMEHVLLDWTLWGSASISVQLAVLKFIERLVGIHQYRSHNLTILRQLNIVQHLLATLQRVDIEVPVIEKLVVLLGILLEDGFIHSELKHIADFMAITFDPPDIIHDISSIPPESMGVQVITRNILLEMLIDLQMSISSEEVLETWHKLVSSQVITFLLDEAVHPTSIRWVMTLIGVCLSSSQTFAMKFRESGGYQALAHVLRNFSDAPELYYILFCLLFGKAVYPRQHEVRMLDFHSLMPNDGSSIELLFPELLNSILAMSKAAFDKMSVQSELAYQTGDYSKFTESLLAGFTAAEKDMTEEFQGDALLHKTYAARLMSGEAAAPTLVGTLLRFMVDLAKMCCTFAAACSKQKFLNSSVDLYFSCARSACAVQATREASAQKADQFKHIFLEEYRSENLSLSQRDAGQAQLKRVVGKEKRSLSGSKDIQVVDSTFLEIEQPASASGEISCVNIFELENVEKLLTFAGVPHPVSSADLNSKDNKMDMEILIPNRDPDSDPLAFVPPSSPPLSEESDFETNLLAANLTGNVSISLRGENRNISESSEDELAMSTEGNTRLVNNIDASTSGVLNKSSLFQITPKLLQELDARVVPGGGPCAAGAIAVLDLIAEVIAHALCEQSKSTLLLEATLDSVLLNITPAAVLVFQGLCLTRVMNFVERRLLRDEEESRHKLDKSRWSSNLDALSSTIVDRLYMGAFCGPEGPLKVLEFLFSMLQLANKDGKLGEITPTSRGMLFTRASSRQIEPYVQTLLKNTNRAVMYCFLPSVLSGINEEFLTKTPDLLQAKLLNGNGKAEDVQGTDSIAVLQLLMANQKLLLCSSNADLDVVYCLLVNVIPMLQDSRQTARTVALDACKALLIHRRRTLEEVLACSPTQGYPLDMFHGGFDKLLSNDVIGFFTWFDDAQEMLQRVLDHRASLRWVEFVAGASQVRNVSVKGMEGYRKKEMTRRMKDILKEEDRQMEHLVERRVALDVIREKMLTDLRVMRQDKYGCMLHAESEWPGRFQQLIHERGLWSTSKITSSRQHEPLWQLCPTEGPFRKRKKIVRCKLLRFDMIGSSSEKYDINGVQVDLPEPTSLVVNIEDPDYHSFFLLFSLGSNSQKRLGYDKEAPDLPAQNGDKEEQVQDGGSSSSAVVQWSIDQKSSDDNTGLSSYKEVVDGKEMCLNLVPQSLSGETPICVPGSPLPSSHYVPEGESKHHPSQKSEDFPDNGDYLIRPYLEPGEKIRFQYNCERVRGLDKHDGIFIIGDIGLYVIENYFIDESGCICEKGGEGDLSVIDRALGVKSSTSGSAVLQEMQRGQMEEATTRWPGAKAWAYSGGAWGKERLSTGQYVPHPWHMWKLESVHELLKRRYQLRPVGIELFSMDGWNELLVFHKGERDEVFKKLLAMNLPRNSMLDTTISGVPKQGSEAGRLFAIMAKSFSKLWINGEISNFQYLMHLNTLAGRGYSDLTQYPVFPWILADYDSDELNLSNPATFRHLDKPMGALFPEREKEFRKRYDTWEDPEIPRFHYGSHYSSAGTVLFYLIRLPPFSNENLKLQGGQFDHADRLFNSMRDTWLSASQGNTSDVKELIPEFFYLPEFLENRFDLDLGIKQSGKTVDDVLLPPWAKGSAHEFIRKHREALESAYVSENLHHWIDLIFGYKQQGKAAVEATNVFFYLTYEGAVDIDSIPDPAMKASILAQINHFGQTPRQLFVKPHPIKKYPPKIPSIHALHNSALLVLQEIRTSASFISQIGWYHDKVIVAGRNCLLKPPSYKKYIAWGFPDNSLRVFLYDQNKLVSTHEAMHDGPIRSAGISQDGKVIITGGEDGVVAVWRLTKNKIQRGRFMHLQRALCAHTESITCITVSQPYGLIVSGSKDCTVIFWDLTNLEYVRQLPESNSPASALHVNDMTGDVITACGMTLAVWSINGDCLAAVNTSHLLSGSILSITTPQLSDWMEIGWFITGHQSGAIKVWHIENPNPEICTVPRRSRIKQRHSVHMEKEPAVLRSATSHSAGRTTEAAQKSCVTGGMPVYQLILHKALKWHTQPVTSLFLSNDLKQLFSGDAGGHLISWTLPHDVGPQGPLQIAQLELCTFCQEAFTELGGKYHCTNCGRSGCNRCCGKYAALEAFGFSRPVRVCVDCFHS
ncbi:hypothetical protein O6H91_19G085400 [Diphasiastrum complanatum]|uniref:Uncharacterized protein n=1 Tax=Diphasiastrum complanatum TaxID=34168 RepID=A0ACC2AXA5_DIPCM|nr:hypothetical protein O6H91_19G085400 [Diphasiastrum complanatum]